MSGVGGLRRDAVRLLYRFKRWMYQGDRPHLLARGMNRPSAIIQATGIILPNRLVTLEVRGRRTGRLISRWSAAW